MRREEDREKMGKGETVDYQMKPVVMRKREEQWKRGRER